MARRTCLSDAADRLTALTQSGNTSTYAYNGQGDRVSQTVSGATTRYTLDLASLYTQVLADGSTSYLYGLGRIGEQQTGGWAYHLTDALGSVAVDDLSGSRITCTTVRPVRRGAPTTAGSAARSTASQGEQTDPSSNVFLRACYYVPGMGRFLTRDTWAGDYAQAADPESSGRASTAIRPTSDGSQYPFWTGHRRALRVVSGGR